MRSECRVSLVCIVMISCSLNILYGEPTIGDDVFAAAEKHMEQYFNGSMGEALVALNEVTSMVENSKVPLYRPREAAYLSIQYCRSYLLYRDLGEKESAEIALKKAQYWQIRRYELHLQEFGKNIDPAMRREMLSLTPERIEKLVRSLDKANTSGKGPLFLIEMGINAQALGLGVTHKDNHSESSATEKH